MRKLLLIILLIIGFSYSQGINTSIIYLLENYNFEKITVDSIDVDKVTANELRVTHSTSTDVSALPAYFSETLSGDFGLASTPAYGMTVYSKILGANLRATDAYEAAITGLYGITGTNLSVYPKAGVLGWIADNTTTADGAFIALIDGDTKVTQAGAAYGVRYLNSTATSGFDYGLDLYGAAIGAYNAVSYRTADIRLGKGAIFDNSTVDLLTVTEANIEFDGNLVVTGNIKGATLESNSGTTINEFSIDGTLAGNSDNAVPTEKAVKTYADAISAAGSDDQKIDEFSGAGNIISISLENDDEGNKTLDISGFTAIAANTAKVTDDDTGVAEPYVDADWDGDIDSPQKNDLRDYFIIIDTDGDGDVDNFDATALAAAETDPNALLTAGTNNIKDTHPDWGTGADQISAVDMPIADGGSIITGTEVETALQENRTAIDLNTSKNTNVPTELSEGTRAPTTYAITSDGGADDIVLPEANTTNAGLLGADKWDEIVDNTLNRTLSAGLSWTIRESASDYEWFSVTYGNGLFVAVSNGFCLGECVMTSPDGINWTNRTTPANNYWQSVTYGNGLFVAVAQSGTDNRVMTSPDGINWTIGVTPEDNSWLAVTYGNGLFVAVAASGTNDRVMTSPDGITWTIGVTPEDNSWQSITYGNDLFVAVATTGTNNRVMKSSDGITWTISTTPEDNSWLAVTYGNGLFVAVATTGTDRVMTSPDGITWTSQTPAADNMWNSITYSNGLFVAVAHSGTDNRVMTSPDGIIWTIRKSAEDNAWYSITYGNGLFAVIATGGTTGHRVMTSGVQEIQELRHDNIYHGGMSIFGDVSISGDLVVEGVQSLFGEMGGHASGNTLTIGITSQNYGVEGEFSAGELNGFTFTAGSNGVIASISTIAAGDSINITDEGHGLVTGDYIAVQSVSHTGLVKVVRIDNDNFHVDINFVGDEVGTWQEGDYLTASAGTEGKYLICMGFTASAGAAAKEYHFHAVQNTTELGTSFTITTSGTNHQSGYGGSIATVTADDRFWCIIENETDAENLLYEDSHIILSKL